MQTRFSRPRSFHELRGDLSTFTVKQLCNQTQNTSAVLVVLWLPVGTLAEGMLPEAKSWSYCDELGFICCWFPRSRVSALGLVFTKKCRSVSRRSWTRSESSRATVPQRAHSFGRNALGRVRPTRDCLHVSPDLSSFPPSLQVPLARVRCSCR